MWKWRPFRKTKFIKEDIQHYFFKDEKLHFSNMPVKNTTRVFWKAENFHLEQAKNIWLLDVLKYEWHILSRFFYWIYNIKKNKGWIRLSWFWIDKFFIQIWLTEKHFYDVNIWTWKWIYADTKNIKRWWNIRYKKRFTNYTRECKTLHELSEILKSYWATASLIKTILSEYKSDYVWYIEEQEKFFDKLKILNSLLYDKDKHRLKKYSNQKDSEDYQKKYWYTPQERFYKKYRILLEQNEKKFKIFSDRKKRRDKKIKEKWMELVALFN